MTAGSASDLLFSWEGEGARNLATVAVEDDTRDALQCVAARQPSREERVSLLELSAQVGVEVSFLGFPAAGREELELCTALAQHAVEAGLHSELVVMSRADRDDLKAALRVRELSGAPVIVDLYVATSELRMVVEDWTADLVLQRLEKVAREAREEEIEVRIAFEDSTRTKPDRLREAINVALGSGATSIVLNDTVGASLPDGARRHIAFARKAIEEAGVADVQLVWHGHNDKGLALANALAAAEAGATLISGTFLGIGERAGNIPLEQLLLLLAEAGGGYRLDLLPELCDLVSRCFEVPIPDDAPLVGGNAFATAAGTHAAAVLKAREFGHDFEDAVYSAVNASALGRSQELIVGPHSGRAVAAAALEAAAIEPDPEKVKTLIEYCRRSGRCLRGPEEVSRGFSG